MEDEGDSRPYQVAMTRRKRKTVRRESSDTDSDERPKKCSDRRQTEPLPISTPTTQTKSALPVFKVQHAEGKSSYATVVDLEKEYPQLKISAKPNLRGEYILRPKDETAVNILKNYRQCDELKPEDKIRKIIVLHYPLHMALTHLQQLTYVVSAERCQVKSTKQETRQVLLTVKGRIPDKLDLGIWGVFQHRPYTPEPLRCFRCQRFGHHKDGCQRPVRCGVCSQPHDTKICLDKHKANQPVQAKCPNCSKAHHAWNLRCPERLKRIQTNLPTPTAEQKPQLKHAPAPLPTKTAWSLPGHMAGGAHGPLPSAMVEGVIASVQDRGMAMGPKKIVQRNRPPSASSKHTGSNDGKSVRVSTDNGQRENRPQTSREVSSAPTQLDTLWPMLKALVTELVESLLSKHGIKQTTETRKTIEHKLKKVEKAISPPPRTQGRKHSPKKQVESSTSESDLDGSFSSTPRSSTPIYTSMESSSDSMDTTVISASSNDQQD